MAFENYSRKDTVQGSTDRVFGFVFTSFFLIVATLKHWPDLMAGASWFLIAALICAIAIICPKILKPFNIVWMRFGLLLHRVMNPIVMGLLFFCVLTPMGLLARAFKWDPMRLKLAGKHKTYWVVRDPSQATDLKNQF